MVEITKDIIRKCKRGNKKNQKLLFNMLYNSILKTCAIYSDSEDNAKKYLKLAFIKIFKNLKKFKNKDSFELWANAVARNLIIDDLKKNKKLAYVKDNNSAKRKDDIEISEDIIKKIKPNQLIELFYNINVSYKIAFIMRVIDKMEYQEIANKLDIDIATSKFSVFKAKKRLKKILSEVQI